MKLSKLHTKQPTKSLQDSPAAPVGKETKYSLLPGHHLPLWNPFFCVVPSFLIHQVPNASMPSLGCPNCPFHSGLVPLNDAHTVSCYGPLGWSELLDFYIIKVIHTKAWINRLKGVVEMGDLSCDHWRNCMGYALYYGQGIHWTHTHPVYQWPNTSQGTEGKETSQKT